LPVATSGIDDAAAERFSTALRGHAAALALLEDGELTGDFHLVLGKMITMETIHAKLRGFAVRLLRDADHLDDTEAARHLGFALSPGMPALAAAAWLEGFLQGAGSMLVHDRSLLGLVDAWLAGLHPEAFQSTLPLLRRTFGTFAPPERARIAAGVATGNRGPAAAVAPLDLDTTRARPAVATVAKLLRLPT
jgi:hypothetical protein